MENKAAADLDAARCRGDWVAVPDLARRYKKYHLDETGMHELACFYAFLMQKKKHISAGRCSNYRG